MAATRANTRSQAGVIRIGIVVLTLAAAAAHLYEAAVAPPVRVLFTLNGLGWLVLLAAHALPLPFLAEHRRLTRWALLGYAALTVAAFFGWNLIRGEWTPLGWVTAALEVVLIGLLWREDRQEEA